MPITEFVKRRYLSEITSTVHTRVLKILQDREIKNGSNTIVKSRILPSVNIIRVLPLLEGSQKVKIIIDVSSENTIEYTRDTQLFEKKIASQHQMEYLLDFTDEVCIKFISIGPLKKVLYDSNKLLAPDLLPYLYKENYEKAADQFLQQFYPFALEQPVTIEPNIAIEKLGLSTIEETLSHDGSILGKMHFSGGISRIYDKHKKGYKDIIVSEKTILYDTSRKIKRNPNITLIHEAYHYYSHKPHIVIKEFLRNQKDYLTFEDDFRDSKKFLEIQATVIPPRILMPHKTFQIKILESLQFLAENNPSMHFLDMLRNTIEELSEFFKVSKQAVRIRMIELGYLEAKGVLEYVDGHYVNDYSFNPKNVAVNQTLTISKHQLANLYLKDDSFRNILDSGEYRYIDSHIVLNHPDLIWNFLKMPMLTSKALQNLDQYALVFTIQRHDADEIYGENDTVLFRLHQSSFTFEAVFNNDNQHVNSKRKAEIMVEQLKREEDLRRRLPNDFAACMKIVKDWQKCTYSEIAEALDCDTKKIERIFRDETGNFQVFVMVMVYLQLPSDIVKHIFNLSRYRIDSSKTEHLIYNLIMNTFQGKTIEYTKTFLEENNIKLAI